MRTSIQTTDRDATPTDKPTDKQAKTAPIAVIKVGGDMLQSNGQKLGLGKNIHALLTLGWQVIVLHGGGPQITDMQIKRGMHTNKVAGRRITTEQDLDLIKQVLCGQVNVDLVAALQAQDVNAFGCHGASGHIIQATKRPLRKISGADEAIDFGEVGEVSSINIAVLQGLLAMGLVPVIASLGTDGRGRVFNINADTTVVQIAAHLKADLLLLTTAVGAIYANIADPTSRIAELNPAAARQYIMDGVITDGMIPKVEEALSLLHNGVSAIAIVNADAHDTFSSVAAGENRIGTRICAD